MGVSVESRPPAGAPRWVALFYEPATASWTVGAESPHRAPVQYAVGEMAQTLRARGADVEVSLWGPRDGEWHRFDAPTATATGPAAPGPPPAEAAKEPAKLAERMTDRRHQVLMAGLSKAGLYDLAPDDEAAVRTMADRLDETTVRRVAHWLGSAGER